MRFHAVFPMLPKEEDEENGAHMDAETHCDSVASSSSLSMLSNMTSEKKAALFLIAGIGSMAIYGAFRNTEDTERKTPVTEENRWGGLSWLRRLPFFRFSSPRSEGLMLFRTEYEAMAALGVLPRGEVEASSSNALLLSSSCPSGDANENKEGSRRKEVMPGCAPLAGTKEKHAERSASPGESGTVKPTKCRRVLHVVVANMKDIAMQRCFHAALAAAFPSCSLTWCRPTSVPTATTATPASVCTTSPPSPCLSHPTPLEIVLEFWNLVFFDAPPSKNTSDISSHASLKEATRYAYKKLVRERRSKCEGQRRTATAGSDSTSRTTRGHWPHLPYPTKTHPEVASDKGVSVTSRTTKSACYTDELPSETRMWSSGAQEEEEAGEEVEVQYMVMCWHHTYHIASPAYRAQLQSSAGPSTRNPPPCFPPGYSAKGSRNTKRSGRPSLVHHTDVQRGSGGWLHLDEDATTSATAACDQGWISGDALEEAFHHHRYRFHDMPYKEVFSIACTLNGQYVQVLQQEIEGILDFSIPSLPSASSRGSHPLGDPLDSFRTSRAVGGEGEEISRRTTHALVPERRHSGVSFSPFTGPEGARVAGAHTTRELAPLIEQEEGRVVVDISLKISHPGVELEHSGGVGEEEDTTLAALRAHCVLRSMLLPEGLPIPIPSAAALPKRSVSPPSTPAPSCCHPFPAAIATPAEGGAAESLSCTSDAMRVGLCWYVVVFPLLARVAAALLYSRETGRGKEGGHQEGKPEKTPAVASFPFPSALTVSSSFSLMHLLQGVRQKCFSLCDGNRHRRSETPTSQMEALLNPSSASPLMGGQVVPPPLPTSVRKRTARRSTSMTLLQNTRGRERLQDSTAHERSIQKRLPCDTERRAWVSTVSSYHPPPSGYFRVIITISAPSITSAEEKNSEDTWRRWIEVGMDAIRAFWKSYDSYYHHNISHETQKKMDSSGMFSSFSFPAVPPPVYHSSFPSNPCVESTHSCSAWIGFDCPLPWNTTSSCVFSVIEHCLALAAFLHLRSVPFRDVHIVECRRCELSSSSAVQKADPAVDLMSTSPVLPLKEEEKDRHRHIIEVEDRCRMAFHRNVHGVFTSPPSDEETLPLLDASGHAQERVEEEAHLSSLPIGQGRDGWQKLEGEMSTNPDGTLPSFHEMEFVREMSQWLEMQEAKRVLLLQTVVVDSHRQSLHPCEECKTVEEGIVTKHLLRYIFSFSQF